MKHLAIMPDLSNYDKIYLEDSPYQYSSLIEVTARNSSDGHFSAIVGNTMGATGLHENSFVVEDNRLMICCSNHIICLTLPDLNLMWSTAADDITCFEIFKYKDKYIVHGELEISCLNRQGQILWRYSGEDIFVTINNYDRLILSDNYIIARDFNNKTYKINYDGSTFKPTP